MDDDCGTALFGDRTEFAGDANAFNGSNFDSSSTGDFGNMGEVAAVLRLCGGGSNLIGDVDFFNCGDF